MQRPSEVAFCNPGYTQTKYIKDKKKKKKGGGSVIRAIFLAKNYVSEQYAN